MLQVESERLEEPWAPYLARKEGKRQIPAALPG
jgi:hypothetical protein